MGGSRIDELNLKGSWSEGEGIAALKIKGYEI
jgi:hypothetical protein